MSEIEKKVDDLGAAWKEFQDANTKAREEMKTLGAESAETKAKLATLNTAMDEAEKARKELEQKIARADRADLRSEDREKADAAAARKEFFGWAKTGEHKGQPFGTVELKVFTEGTDTGAGVFVLPQLMTELLKGVIEFSPFRSAARVVSTSATSVKWPKRTGVFAAVWVGEQTTRAETTGLTYGSEEIPTHEMQAMVDVSNWMLEDSSFDLEGQLSLEANEQFGVAEGAAFLSGSGTAKPEGIITNSAVGTTTVQTSNDLTDWTKLVDIAAVPKTAYLAGSAWFMNRSSIGKVRKMIDGASRPIWEPAQGTLSSTARPQSILGYPVIECPDMDSAGSSKKPIIFGNMSKAYIVVDRTSVITLRDPFTQQASGNVRFWFRRRVGGQVVITEALRIGT